MRSKNNKSHISFVHVSPSGLSVSLISEGKSTRKNQLGIVSSADVTRVDVARKREN